MIVDLPFIWAMLIALAVLMYVVLDGFDLGIGILFPAIKGERNRDVMMKSIAPVWDGNETWLVLGGGGLFAVFPLAYSVLLTALYAPLIAMLLALIFRGVAFEFRFKDRKHKPLWDLAFAGGSTAAAFSQGVVLGAFIQGIEIEGRSYAGGWFDWLTPFSLFTGLALVLGYGLLGAGWLVLKTTGALQQKVFVIMRPLAIATLAAIAAVSLWTPLLNGEIAERWFSWPNIVYLSPVPLLVAAGAAGLYRAIQLKPGVNLLADLSSRTVDRIAPRVAEVKRPGDVVVASIHWGGNWGYDIPEAQRAFAHALIDVAGVDLVHGHSSHHPKSIEVHHGRLVLYGAGDFLNDYEGISGHEEFRDDLVLMYLPALDASRGALLGLDMVPFRLRRFRLERVSRRDAQWLRDLLNREGAPLGTRAELTDDDTLRLGWD